VAGEGAGAGRRPVGPGSAVTVVVEERDAYRLSFERFAAAHAASDPRWLRERRTAAMARFVERGLPGPRDEAWRHTPAAPLTRGRFEPAPAEARPAPDALAALPQDGLGGPRAVFVNGRFSSELSWAGPGRSGVEVASLREVLGSRPERIEAHLGQLAAGETGVFADLNTAFAEDGAVVFLAPGTIVSEPVHLVHLSAGEGPPSVSYMRTLVVASPGSEARIVESFAGPAGRSSLTNAVTEVVVGDNAYVDRYKLQREGGEALHVATLAATLGRDSRFRDHSIALGAALSRNDIDVRFGAEGGEVRLNGLFVMDGRRVADTHSRIDHARPHCSSRELYKGILDGQSRGVFNGLVVVRPGAQKTDALQMNKNLLLSREALAHSTPQLEILADDVKCKHGSTTGQLDPEALFYLRSRGIDEAAASGLLTWAFANELLGQMEIEPLVRLVERQLQRALPGAIDVRGGRP
jgi:Fe-S cluster assembly protein SufD